jgi:uncharacterized protein (DUF362 family)
MDRRTFIQLAGPALLQASGEPAYHTVSPYAPSSNAILPGPYRGVVTSVHSDAAVNGRGQADGAAVRRMLSAGLRSLTGAKSDRDAWAAFFAPSDVVGIKVNCSGAPNIMSDPEVVGGVVENLIGAGVKPQQIYIYERFLNQLESVHYDRQVPSGVHIVAVETPRGSILGYDPHTYVEVDFFGEDDTRSNLVRLVSERFTKIINIPNMKDHGASGVTGCLKNMAYGNFSNVARSHRHAQTHTLSFIGTLASIEPLRSKTVLHVMDGLRGVWHGGPFVRDRRFLFYPKSILFGTDPVAMDRLLLDIIEEKRKSEGALSLFDRSTANINERRARKDPRVNVFIREPGHIEYAAKLGLGENDKTRIRLTPLNV